MTTPDMHDHLQKLESERAAAALAGLDGNDLYMRDLLGELEAARAAFVGAAVTDIAVLRGELYGRLQG